MAGLGSNVGPEQLRGGSLNGSGGSAQVLVSATILLHRTPVYAWS